MAIDYLQGRPVTPVAFTVTTLTGIVDAVETLDIGTAVGLVDGTYTGVATGGATAGNDDLTVSVVVSGTGTIVTFDTVSIVDGGTGYDETQDAGITIDATLLGGSAGSLTFDVASTVGAVATTTVTDGGTGWITGDAITADETISDGSGSGVSVTVTASALVNDTPETGGVVSALTIVEGGEDYVGGDLETVTYNGDGEVGVPSEDYVDHDEYELGGVVVEYAKPYNATAPQSDWQGTMTGGYNPADTPSLEPDDNNPEIGTVLLADMPQLAVQKKYIDDGSVVVYAEPTIVNGSGEVVGNTVRAEDIGDEARCTALGFTWTTESTGDGNTGSYGYCYEPASAFDSGLVEEECVRSGFYFDADLDVCVDTSTPANMTTYGQVACKEAGWFFDGTDCVDWDTIDFGVDYTTQLTCDAAGGVWIAGTCFSPESFGNGQSGNFSETVGSHND